MPFIAPLLVVALHYLLMTIWPPWGDIALAITSIIGWTAIIVMIVETLKARQNKKKAQKLLKENPAFAYLLALEKEFKDNSVDLDPTPSAPKITKIGD